MSGGAFAVLYRWTVAAEHEAGFIERWREATLRLRDSHGALGSCLSRTEDGAFVAFARWPSEQARAAAFKESGPAQPWPGILSFEQTKLAVLEDLLTRTG